VEKNFVAPRDDVFIGEDEAREIKARAGRREGGRCGIINPIFLCPRIYERRACCPLNPEDQFRTL
jgi:hypothetical protein